LVSSRINIFAGSIKQPVHLMSFLFKQYMMYIRPLLLFYFLTQAFSAFYAVRATAAKFSLRVGNMKFNTQDEE
jgi:hypothetical protein